jgi:hypothetical protein
MFGCLDIGTGRKMVGLFSQGYCLLDKSEERRRKEADEVDKMMCHGFEVGE